MTALAGTEHTLVCTATKNASLSTAVLEVEWLGPNGPLVDGQDGITIAGEPSTMDNNTLTSSLTFTNLVTSQGGMYTCSVNLTIPEANITDHNVRRRSSFKVQSECLTVFSVDQELQLLVHMCFPIPILLLYCLSPIPQSPLPCLCQ